MEDQQLSKQEKKEQYMKKYRANKKEEIKAHKKQYREIQAKCSCGMEIVKNNMARHLQTKKKTQNY